MAVNNKAGFITYYSFCECENIASPQCVSLTNSISEHNREESQKTTVLIK